MPSALARLIILSSISVKFWTYVDFVARVLQNSGAAASKRINGRALPMWKVIVDRRAAGVDHDLTRDKRHKFFFFRASDDCKFYTSLLLLLLKSYYNIRMPSSRRRRHPFAVPPRLTARFKKKRRSSLAPNIAGKRPGLKSVRFARSGRLSNAHARTHLLIMGTFSRRSPSLSCRKAASSALSVNVCQRI